MIVLKKIVFMIEINNLTAVLVDKKSLIKTVKEVFGGEKIKNDIGLSIALIGLARMKEINKKYRGEKKATDVLSFSEEELPDKKTRAKHAVKDLGEIIICPQEVKKNTKRFNSNFRKELTKVLIHGILHLLGYNHEKSRKEAKKMEKKSEYYFYKILNS